MSRLADYFVIVGYDHEKESKFPILSSCKYKHRNITSTALLHNSEICQRKWKLYGQNNATFSRKGLARHTVYRGHRMVLSTTRMGIVHRETGTEIFRFGSHRHRCKSPLLRLFVLQRNGFDNTEQTSRWRGGKSYARSTDDHYNHIHQYCDDNTSQYYVRSKVFGIGVTTGLCGNVPELSGHHLYGLHWKFVVSTGNINWQHFGLYSSEWKFCCLRRGVCVSIRAYFRYLMPVVHK